MNATFAFVLCLFASACLPAAAFDLQGHRGARGMAPENTLPGFERALAIGVHTLELDVGLTADGVVVISHDPYLDPAITRDRSGRWLSGKGPLLRSLTMAQLESYDVGRIDPGTAYARTFATQQPRDGTRIPTLASLFERVKALGANDVRFNIETKINPARPEDTAGPQEMVQALLEVIRNAGMARRVSIQSFDWRTLRLVQQLEPSIPTVCLTVQNARNDNLRGGEWTGGLNFADYGSAPRMAKAAGCTAWSPNGDAVTESLVKEAQSLGLKVIPWTINDEAEMDRLIGWGVDGLITDYPDRLRAVMKARKLPLPPPAGN
jgi:glycerophosphoryl diester phosphodiesterase